MTKNPLWRKAPLAIGLLMATHSAMALDWTGYFRGGPGVTEKNTSRACYGLGQGSSGMKYRLGNECDFYGEFQLTQGFSKDGIESKVTLMTNHYTGATDTNGNGLGIEQMFAEAKGFDIAPEATFWIGRERGRRGDVHIVDTFFIEMLGVGAGVKDLKAGPGKLGMAFYKTDGGAVKPGNRVNMEWYGIESNPGGNLSLIGTLTSGDFDGGTKGAGLTLRHEQSNLAGTGLNNALWLQYAQGSANLNGNFGNLTSDSKAKGLRLVDSINWQKGAFGGQAMVLVASEKDGAGVKTDSASVGGRISYALTRNFKMVTELGYSQFKTDGAETATLTKLTIAPTLSVGPDFFSRPEFRLYATMANWNKAAGNVTGQTGFADKTSGNSFGAQVEWWF
ncbi:maltoporin [Ideonella sp.]|uniref:maltoporin n=1 Tax=Ideonella sp. TaxID=1929293 RepID=UPI003BB56C24